MSVQQSWSHPKSIAVATDLTDLDYLLPHARAQAAATGAKLCFIHVIPPQVYVSPQSGAYPFVPKEKAFRDAEQEIAEVTGQLRKEGFLCEYEIRRWFEAEQIVAFVREKSVDRLLIATSGKGKLGKLLLGSVAEEVIRTVDIPVCTIGPHVTQQAGTDEHNVLYATSLRHDAESSLQFALDFTAASKSQLTVLHVVEHASAHSQQGIDARVEIDSLLKQLPHGPIEPKVLLRFGDPAKEILCEAAVLKPEMLVLGAVPASNLTATVRTGVAYEVITKASCPVLTLRVSSGSVCNMPKSSPASDHVRADVQHIEA